MSCMCVFSTRAYSHTDGINRPRGAYATELAPWLPKFSQKDLLSVLYNRPRGKTATHYVAILKDALWKRLTGVEWVKSEPIVAGGPLGAGVQVFAIGSGANLMRTR